MHLTERYIQLCRELAAAGYQWQPRPGDWMLDLNDESVGTLTTQIQRPELVVRNNVHLPYGSQLSDLMALRGIEPSGASTSERVWTDRNGALLHKCDADQAAAFPDDEALLALIADFRKHGR